MDEIILLIATTLSITPMDVYVLGVGIVLWGILLIIGIQKTYELYFGLVVGLAIYLMLTVLLSSTYQTPDTIRVLSPGVSKFMIGSSVYLIFILMILTPLSGGIRFPYTNTRLIRVLEHLIISGVLLGFLSALIIGFISRSYVFGVETGFVLLGKTLLYREMISGVILWYIAAHLQPFVLFSVIYLLYKLLFSEIIGAILLTLWYWVLSLRYRSRGGEYQEAHSTELQHDSNTEAGEYYEVEHRDWVAHEDPHANDAPKGHH
jgi:hypothetical protein